MPLIFQKLILRADLKANPQALYVFGDNLARWGLAGQAREMRGQVNSIGLPTKRSPTEFLTNADLEVIKSATLEARFIIEERLNHLEVVVWPLDGIGTGLAELGRRAPLIESFYAEFLEGIRWR